MFTELELMLPADVHNLLEELARYRDETLENMVVNMLIEELDGELRNDDEMGQTIAKYLRRKHHFKEDE